MVCDKSLWIFLVFLIAITGRAQESLRLPNPFSKSDFNFTTIQRYLPLYEFKADSIKKLSMRLDFNPARAHSNFYSPENVLPAKSYQLDTRSSSYYVPRNVGDKLTDIMNRPRDTAFVPVLGAAFLAAQLAANYLWIEKKIELNKKDLIVALENFEVLNEILIRQHINLEQLYKIESINSRMTASILQAKLEILTDSKLLHPKKSDDKHIEYYAAFSSGQISQAIDRALAQADADSLTIAQLKQLQLKLHQPGN